MVEMIDRSVGPRESGRPVIGPSQVDLAALLGECVAAQALRARDKGLVLRLEVGAELSVPVTIDPGGIERILDNLLGNAIKFCHPTSRITLRARSLAGVLELEVEDDGPGIPAAEQATLFDPYQTGSTRPTGGERSTGLGLAIVKELVLANRGTIGLRSEVGQGSTFSVRLPLEGRDLVARERRGTSHGWPVPASLLAG
jgi:signal transduction histidine kinase